MYYKNVDITDLTSILEKGILPIDKCGNHNWDSGRRAGNATDVVYLFRPKRRNCLKMYGLALIEISDNITAHKTSFVIGDRNEPNYDEYITDQVNTEDILNIYLPEFLKDRILADPRYALSKQVKEHITWVPFKAYVFTPDEKEAEFFDDTINIFPCGYRECNDYEYSLMQKGTCALSTNESAYMRGWNDDRSLCCDYDILQYVL